MYSFEFATHELNFFRSFFFFLSFIFNKNLAWKSFREYNSLSHSESYIFVYTYTYIFFNNLHCNLISREIFCINNSSNGIIKLQLVHKLWKKKRRKINRTIVHVMHIHRDLNYIIIIKSTRVSKPQNHRNKSIKRIKNNIERERERIFLADLACIIFRSKHILKVCKNNWLLYFSNCYRSSKTSIFHILQIQSNLYISENLSRN